MDKNVLFKAEPATLDLIKCEAEKNLSSIQSTEDVITNKSNNLLQILLPITLILLGYGINNFSNFNFDWRFYFSISLAVLLAVVIGILYNNILPVKTAVSGTEPNQLMQEDMISGDEKRDGRYILVNRVYNLQVAIDYALQSHKIRYKRFKNANKILLLGLLGIFILFSLYQIFLLFPDKY